MATEQRLLFVDTWGWLALEDAKDPAHERVDEIRREHSLERILWVTTDYVLDETFTRLFRRRPFAEAKRFCEALSKARNDGLLKLENVGPERFRKAFTLRLRYRDKPRISFTDLTSFVVMTELGIPQVLTGDAHFAQVGLGFRTLP